jgi:hypothetical protein
MGHGFTYQSHRIASIDVLGNVQSLLGDLALTVFDCGMIPMCV